MKNIHLLPTDKPSRLIIYSTLLNEFRLLDEPIEDWKHKQHIYITSDEEIKDGDAVIHDLAMFCELENPCDPDNLKSNTRKKIILTTDQELIEDGVQPIDDGFLEWFVKNPSCEFVETDESKYFDGSHGEYLIIIPQEEPKQENCTFCEGTRQIVSSTTISGFKTCDCINIPKEESIQETLEEAAEIFYSEQSKAYEDATEPMFDNSRYLVAGFIDGAKWQAKTMYSKEAVEEMLATLKRNSIDNIATIHNIDLFIESWTREFKK